MLKQIEAGVLSIAYFDNGPRNGTPVLLLHGFPYDVHAYDAVSSILLSKGCRVIVSYLRGYGSTQFLSSDTPRSGQQAVLAHDLLALMDALEISRAVLAGYDWGGRAACILSALWPERVQALVSVGGYNIQDIPGSTKPQIPKMNTVIGISTIFTLKEGGQGYLKTVVSSVSFFGGFGRLPGVLRTKISTRQLSHLIIQTLLTW